MTTHPATASLPALRAAVASTEFAGAELIPLADTGLAHHHVRLAGHPVLARIPKQSQMQLEAVENLRHQAACFERVSASGHGPQLFGVLEPRPGLERGALLVEFIEGRAASLPGDLDVIMTALARIHALEVPARADRAPLGDADDPLAALAGEITMQAGFLDGVVRDGPVHGGPGLDGAQLDSPVHGGPGLDGAVLDGVQLDSAVFDPAARCLIDSELRALRALVLRDDRPTKHLITFDAHPGNFVIRPDGTAVIVDLEKCRYSYPALDLAHATLYTSTTWESGDTVALTPPEVRAALDVWAREFTAAGGMLPAGDLEWEGPLRRAMWLWSVTWCAKWRVLSGSAASASSGGEDWAAANSTEVLSTHVRGRVDHYLDAEVIARIIADFDAAVGAR